MAANSYDQGETSPEIKDDKSLLEEALARFKLAEEAEQENRTEALDDLKFAAGDQWDAEIKERRKRQSRPCLTVNRLPAQIKQVTNDQRQNRPSIKVHPVDDLGDPDTAKIHQGIIRHIEYNSNADAAYDTAFDGAVRGGLGFWRVITQYVSPTSFDQEILIKTIRNRFSVFFDPFSKEADGSDASWAFVIEDLDKEVYSKTYPKSKLASMGEWESIGNTAPGWMSSKSARVAEYFYKEYRDADLVQLSGGEVIEKDGLADFAQKQALLHGISPDLTVVRERRTQIPVIKWCKINAVEILEQTDWLGIYIPIVPVYGEVLDIDGKVTLKGIVRDAKDPQRMLNVWKSAETETIGLAPKAPFIVEENQIKGYEADWASANVVNHAFLKYKATSVNGTPLPPPQRQSFEPAVQAITQAAMLAADDIKATTGIYDASLGARSNETSGVAIQRRNNQAQTSNFHFVDNLTRSIRHTGRILIDLIPKVYDTAQAIRIIGEDGQQEVIRINEEFKRKGEMVVYDLSKGKYDVTVDVGPSYASKRQEAVEAMMEVTRAVPQLMQVAGDLMVKSMDWPGAQEIADRLKKTLPPGLADDPEKDQKPLPPEVQAQMQQMQQMVEQLTGQLNEASDTIQQKRLELESKERIEFAKLETQLEIKRAELDAKDSLALLNAQISQIEQRLQLLNMGAPIEDVTQDQMDPSQMQPQEAPMDPQGFDPQPQDDGSMDPTGGAAPGLPMEGMQPHVDPSDQQF